MSLSMEEMGRDEGKGEIMPLPGCDERDIYYRPVNIEEACMSVNLIFKIICGGNPGLRLKPGLKAQRKGRAGVPYKPCGASAGAVLDRAIHL